MLNGHPIDAEINGPVEGGQGFNVTIRIDQAVSQDTPISLASGNTSIVTGPASAIVPAGHNSVLVPFSSSPVTSSTSVTIYAGPGGAMLPAGATTNKSVLVMASAPQPTAS